MTWDQLHDEDVLFEFNGNRADQLTPGRFYVGTIDGFAEFGVFVTLGSSVTGLLHRTNIDGRLENLEWSEGDEVIVQVEGVRDNGNVDLAWSIRQSPTEFRGSGVDDPSDGNASASIEEEPSIEEEEKEEEAEPEETSTEEHSLRTISIADADDLIGDRIRIFGRVTDVRQTNGPTIFTVRDETDDVECAAFEAAGVRAFPEIDVGALISLIGCPERHRGTLQIETEEIDPLAGDERDKIAQQIDAADAERAAPNNTELVIDTESIADLASDLGEVASALRGAVFDGRSIVIRHPTSVDGVVAGAGIEHALRQLSARTYEDQESVSWFVTRRPMDESWYDLGDAMYDVTDGTDRDDLVLIVGAGDSPQDEAALSFLDVYDLAYETVDTFGIDADEVAPLATNVAGMVEESVREDLVHLPAIGSGKNAPASYESLAVDHGYDATAIAERHQALALVAYYQKYDDKRELIADLLFDGEEAGELATHVSGQFRQRLDTTTQTAVENGSNEDGIFSLDADSLTHRFAFPPRRLLADALLDEIDAETVLVLDEDEAFIAGTPVDLDAIAEAVQSEVSNAAVGASRDRITFLSGKRDAVHTALLNALIES